MERIAVFLDFANIEASAQCRIDYGALRQYLGEGRHIIECLALCWSCLSRQGQAVFKLV